MRRSGSELAHELFPGRPPGDRSLLVRTAGKNVFIFAIALLRTLSGPLRWRFLLVIRTVGEGGQLQQKVVFSF
jgi:hypothetical protein